MKLYIVWMNDYDATPENIEKIFLTDQEALDWISRNISINTYIRVWDKQHPYFTMVECWYSVVEYNMETQTQKTVHRYEQRIEFEGQYE